MKKRFWMGLAAAVLLTGMNVFADFKTSGRTDREKPDYRVGERVNFKISAPWHAGRQAVLKLQKDGEAVATPPVTVTLDSNGRYDGFSAGASAPGFMLLSVKFLDKDGKFVRDERNRDVELLIGASVDREKILPTYEPAGFDDFWEKRLEELSMIPWDVMRIPVANSSSELKGKVDMYDVKVASTGNIPVSGYLSIPAGAEKKSLPAVLKLHGAGVRSAYPTDKEALERNAIVFDINAHGLPNGKDKSFYEEKAREMRNYQYGGLEKADTAYMVGMYQRVARALQYLKSLPEWDGKNLAVSGGSQGGAQALAGAALDKQVNYCAASVAWMCNLNGSRSHMIQPRWSQMVKTDKDGKPLDPVTSETCGMIDAANFAKRVKCKTVMSVGYIDVTCPPGNVYAAYNNLGTKDRKMLDYYFAGHGGPVYWDVAKSVWDFFKSGNETK